MDDRNDAWIATLDEAVATAEQFQKLYYDTLDKRRHLVNKLYLESAILVWEGNIMRNNLEIQRFYEGLPPTTHLLSGLDAQPLSQLAVDQKTIIVQVEGSVSFQHGSERSPRQFHQSFTITAQDEKWKIASDCFRLAPDR